MGAINTPFSSMDRLTRQKKKINKETPELICSMDQIDLSDIYRTFHPTQAKFTFFISLWNLLQDRPHSKP